VYAIEFDEESGILTLTSGGLWDLAEVERYHKGLADVLGRLRPKYPNLRILSDTRDLPLVTQDVAAALSDFMNSEIMRPTGRTAVLVAKTLNKMQAERVADNPLVKVFFDEAEARAWLTTAGDA
jgi:hypothetical protein